MIVKMEMPNPMPFSSNCDVSGCWKLQVNGNMPGSNGNTQDPMSTVDNTPQNVPNIEMPEDNPMPTNPEIFAA